MKHQALEYFRFCHHPDFANLFSLVKSREVRTMSSPKNKRPGAKIHVLRTGNFSVYHLDCRLVPLLLWHAHLFAEGGEHES